MEEKGKGTKNKIERSPRKAKKREKKNHKMSQRRSQRKNQESVDVKAIQNMILINLPRMMECGTWNFGLAEQNREK